MSGRRKACLIVLGGVTALVLFLPRPLSLPIMRLRSGSLREANEVGTIWLENGAIDRELTLQLGEVALHDPDTEMRRKCLTVLGLAQLRFPRECAAVARKLLQDDEPYIVSNAAPLLGNPLSAADCHLLIGIWRHDARPVQSAVVIALQRSPDVLTWYARLLRAHEVADTELRDIIWKNLQVFGCDVNYSMGSPEGAGQWEAVVEWLKEKSPADWK